MPDCCSPLRMTERPNVMEVQHKTLVTSHYGQRLLDGTHVGREDGWITIHLLHHLRRYPQVGEGKGADSSIREDDAGSIVRMVHCCYNIAMTGQLLALKRILRAYPAQSMGKQEDGIGGPVRRQCCLTERLRREMVEIAKEKTRDTKSVSQHLSMLHVACRRG